MSKCRSCQSEIVWATSQKGKAMPLDPKVVTVVETVDGPDGREVVRMVRGRVSHFATCPNANEHRKR